MSTSQHAYERLQRANPLSDTTAYEPTLEEAVAFLATVKEEPMARQDDLVDLEPTGGPTRRWLVAAATFLVVLVVGGAIGVVLAARTTETDAGAKITTTTSSLSSARDEVSEPTELETIRKAVNRGDAAAAARIHTTEEGCDRFFTTGVETCTDWYEFLIGIGTVAVEADCDLESGAAMVACRWTVESEAHRALGIDSVKWEFTVVGIDGWSTVFPDGNLFTGIPGLGQLDDDFWEHVTTIVEFDTGSDVPTAGNRVPATLNAEFAGVVLDAAASFGTD